MLSVSSSCCWAEAAVASPPRAARVVAPVRAAPLRNDRLEVPEGLSSGEGMTSISFGVLIALRLLFRFLESHTLLMSGVEGAVGDSSGWIEDGRGSAMDIIGSGYFQGNCLVVEMAMGIESLNPEPSRRLNGSQFC